MSSTDPDAPTSPTEPTGERSPDENLSGFAISVVDLGIEDEPSWRSHAVDLGLLLVLIVTAVACGFAAKREYGHPEVWWESEGYRRLEAAARGIDRATFISDDISKETNLRLHSTQYSIIPCVLRLTLEWSEVFARIDAGEFLVCDFSSPKRLDAAIEELRAWGALEKRDVIAQRLSPHLALMKAGERP